MLERTLRAIKAPKLRMQLIDKKMLMLICRAKEFCNIKILTGMYRTPEQIADLPEVSEEEKLEKEIRILKNGACLKSVELYFLG